MSFEMAACGAWPANAVDDVMTAIQNLQHKGFVNNDFTVLIPQTLKQTLWTQLPERHITYYNYMKAVEMVYEVIISDIVKDNEVIVLATIKNTPFFQKIGDVEVINQESKVKITHVYSSV